METPTQITFRHMDVSPAVEARILEEVLGLDRCYDRITSCHVVVEAPHHHQQHGHTFHVSIDLHVPGSQIEVNHTPHGCAGESHAPDAGHRDVYVAIRDAFAAARRQLQDYARILRGDVKHHAEKAPAD
ncbi:MAG: hypothetical protein B7Z47_01305 [Chthoniobacter sp. 12-60-6]|nr:MAG: hypothetical protein B7Z47_01305 [Chthoniobacter sp. 12-60-6]